MFSTFYYIIILFFQSLYAESNFRYNQQIEMINQLVTAQKYETAFSELSKLEKKGVFTNNDISRMQRNLALKIHAKSNYNEFNPRTIGEYVIKSLSYYQQKQFSNSLVFTSNIIVNKPIVADSMIKMFEIIASQVPVERKIISKNNQRTITSNLRINEAMNLLDLMKRKEKTLF